MGDEAISTMKFLALVVSSLGFVTALFGADSAGPVITVRKGTSLEVAVKDIGGAAGVAATTVLRNDIQLSGVLSLGDAATATIMISGTASAASFTGHATEKTGGVVLHKDYTGESLRSIHQ